MWPGGGQRRRRCRRPQPAHEEPFRRPAARTSYRAGKKARRPATTSRQHRPGLRRGQSGKGPDRARRAAGAGPPGEATRPARRGLSPSPRISTRARQPPNGRKGGGGAKGRERHGHDPAPAGVLRDQPGCRRSTFIAKRLMACGRDQATCEGQVALRWKGQGKAGGSSAHGN